VGVNEIVMGSHGRGALAGAFMGSVAQKVVHLANIPVVLVK
jgi:nucleotide-binding universal stress UspA family protein